MEKQRQGTANGTIGVKRERGEEKKMGHKGSLRKTVEQKESGIYVVTGNKEKMGD